MNLKLLPSDRFTICARDSISVVRQNLIENVENNSMVRSIERLSFRGIVSECIFEIFPVYKFDFHAPAIIGKFESIENETLIHVQIKLRFHQYFFMTALCLQLIFVFNLLVESYLYSNPAVPSWRPILCWVNIIFVSLLIGLNARLYKIEHQFAKTKIKQIFLSRSLS